MQRIKYFFTLLLVLSALTACEQEEIAGLNRDTGKEGDPAQLYIRLQDLGMEPNSRGIGLTEDEERNIKSLFLFVFDESGVLISSTEHIDVTLHGTGGTTWNPIPIHSIVGNDRQIYAVANYNSQVIENIKAVSSLDDLKNLIVQNLGNPLSQEYGIIKVGSTVTNIRDGETYDIPLKNLVAKVTVKVINKCSDFDIDGWTIDGFPLKSYIVERPFDPDNLNYNDAPNINDESDFYNSFADQSFKFETESSSNGVTTYTITGYCYENRRGGKISREDPPAGWPNGNAGSGPRKPYQEKSWYAPKNATRIRIVGQNTATQRGVTINHYLGKNNVDDYNVERGKHYTYTITVNNLDDIDIDTNVDQYSEKLPVYTPPDLMNIDAHASMRVFQLYTNRLRPNSGKISFEVLSGLSTETERPDWLKVAMFPLINFQVKGGGAYGGDDIAPWQQDGVTPGHYARSKYIPHKSVRVKLQNYSAPNGVILGNDDSGYPDDDDVLPFSKSTRRMCYKITDIPIPDNYDPVNNQPTSMFIYANEFEFSSDPKAPDSREAIVRITYTPAGGTPEYMYYTVRQYRPQLFMGLPGELNPMLLERTEDYNGLVQQITPFDQQLLNGLQWGPPVSGETEQAVSPNNGFLNTVQAVYTDAQITGNNYTWNNERTKFGGNTGGWSGIQGAIVQPVALQNITGRPFYMFNYTSTDNYNSLFNTTAARYCHEKNADINGDGTISPNETFWYLPSEQELQMMWTYNEMLNLSPVFYWSSTLPSAGVAEAYAISMRRSPADVNTIYNGVPQTRQRTGYKESNITPPKVRCIRRGSGVTSVSPIVTHTVDGRSVIDCSSLPGDMYTTTSKLGISQKDIGSLQNTNTKVYKKFEVQRSADNSQISYSELYHGTGKCNESQGWRLPTQREMLLIWSVKDKLEANSSFAKFKANTYWTLLRIPSGNYLVDFKTGIASYLANPSGNHYYRCIREL